jgi:trimethylamine:corrinoid methyltransferase-like protein
MHAPKVSFLPPDKIAMMRARVLELLEQRGVQMEHPEVTRRLAEAGAAVDGDTSNVRFPAAFMEEVLARAPKQVELFGRDAARRLEIPRPEGGFLLRTGTGAHGYIDPETGSYRKVTAADAAAWAGLADVLDEVDFCAFPFVDDVPVPSADLHGLMAVLSNTRKHAWIQPYTAESIEYLLNLAAAAAGGEQALRDAPRVSIIATALTPLSVKFMDLEVIRLAARFGVPVHACSLPSAAGTAPITMPATVLMAAAEILAMLAAAQVMEPAVPVIATPLVFALDMRTGRGLQSSVEAMQGAAAAVQLMKQGFGLPTHTYGSGTDSPVADGQSMTERALLGLLTGLARADILGGAGQLEVATAISPVQLCIDDELAAMIRRLLRGLEVDDDTLAWDEISAVAPGGHFLATPHTLRHCREGFMPKLFTRLPRDAWEAKGEGDLAARARERCRALLSEPAPEPVPEDTRREMAAVVAAADRRLAGTG